MFVVPKPLLLPHVTTTMNSSSSSDISTQGDDGEQFRQLAHQWSPAVDDDRAVAFLRQLNGTLFARGGAEINDAYIARTVQSYREGPRFIYSQADLKRELRWDKMLWFLGIVLAVALVSMGLSQSDLSLVVIAIVCGMVSIRSLRAVPVSPG